MGLEDGNQQVAVMAVTDIRQKLGNLVRSCIKNTKREVLVVLVTGSKAVSFKNRVISRRSHKLNDSRVLLHRMNVVHKSAYKVVRIYNNNGRVCFGHVFSQESQPCMAVTCLSNILIEIEIHGQVLGHEFLDSVKCR